MGVGVTVALLGSKELGRELGKKGTTSDLTLYNSSHDGHAVTVVEPSQFPEKFPPLLYALGMADRHLLVVTALTREIAETVATADAFPQPIEVAIGESLGEEELRRTFKGTKLESAPMRPLDPAKLRDEMIGWAAPARDGPVRARIDHAFPVKGVGAVALGVVVQGVLHAHEKLRLFPTDKMVEARSVQVHDVDVHEAMCGERVGIALKGADADEISRGQVLAPEGTLSVAEELDGTDLARCQYYRGSLSDGGQANVLVGLQLVPARVSALTASGVHLAFDRPVAFEPGEPGYLADLSAAQGPRFFGRVRLSGK